MPFIDSNQPYNYGINYPEVPDQGLPEKESPAFFSETIPAAFRVENSVGSYITSENIYTRSAPDPNYKPGFEGYEEYAPRFIEVENYEQEQILKRNIDRERKDRQILEESGWIGTAAMFAAGALDPINLIPVGGQAVRAYKTGSILKGGLMTARAGLLGSTASEIALHASQETRTFGESAMNVSAATFLSGVLGAGGMAFAKSRAQQSGKLWSDLEKNLEETLTVPKPNEPDIFMGEFKPITEAELKSDTAIERFLDFPVDGEAVGAARVDYSAEKLKSAFGFERLKLDPVLQTATSPSLKTRKFAQELAEVPLIYEKNDLGIATTIAAETRIKALKDSAFYRMYTDIQSSFEEYRGSSLNKSRLLDVLPGQRDKLTFSQFKEEISRAMRRDDISEIPGVENAAKKLRKVIDDIKDEAASLGLLPEDVRVKTAPSYLTRIYDKLAINNNRFDWEARLERWFVKQNPEMDTLEIKDLVQRTTNNILGNPDDISIYKLPPSGPFKERVFDIPDNLIEDYLINDVEAIINGYINKWVPEIELKKAGFDNEGLKLKLEEIAQDYNEKSNQLKALIAKKYDSQIKSAKGEQAIASIEKKRDKEIAKSLDKVAKQREKDIYNLKGMRERIKGTFQLNSTSVLQRADLPRVTSTLKAWNYSRLLGMVVGSSVGDVGTPILINGMMRTFRDNLIPFIRNLPTIRSKGTVRAQGNQELRDMGVAVELILNTRVRNFADLGYAVTGSKLTTLNHTTTKSLSYLSGISVWNDKMRLMSGYSAMARILRAAESKKLSKSDVQFLARFGIDESKLKRIGEQFKLHGNKGGGRYASGSANWTDKSAYQDFQAAIRKFVDSTIIVPGQDKPFIFSTPWGSTFFQFKSFAYSSYQRVFLAGLQQRDMATLNGAVSMIALGMLSLYIKSTIAGKELPEDPEKWIAEGIDRSGILGHLMDLNNTLAKAGLGFGSGPSSRYQSRSGAAAIAGPSYSLLEDLFTTGRLATGLLNGEKPSESDIHAARRIIPFQNAITVRKIFDAAEEGLIDYLGAKKSTKAQNRNR